MFAGNQPFSGFCVVLNIALDDWSVKYLISFRINSVDLKNEGLVPCPLYFDNNVLYYVHRAIKYPTLLY